MFVQAESLYKNRR